MPFNPRAIPLIGSDIAQIGQVVDIFATPCAPEPKVWVRAFWQAVPFLLISLFKPEPVEITPLRRRNRRHGKGIRITGRFQEMAEVRFSVPRGFGWVAFTHEIMERVGWWLLVLDATTDFAVYWTSTVYEYAGCTTPGAPYAQLWRNKLQSFAIAEAGWGGPHLLDFRQHIFQAGGDQITVPAGAQASFQCWFTTVPAPPPFHGSIGGIRVREVGGDVVAEGDLAGKPGEPQTATLVTSVGADLNRIRTYRMEVFYNGDGNVLSSGAGFEAHGTILRNILPDP